MEKIGSEELRFLKAFTEVYNYDPGQSLMNKLTIESINRNILRQIRFLLPNQYKFQYLECPDKEGISLFQDFKVTFDSSIDHTLITVRVIEALYIFMNTDIFFYGLFNLYNGSNKTTKEKSRHLINACWIYYNQCDKEFLNKKGMLYSFLGRGIESVKQSENFKNNLIQSLIDRDQDRNQKSSSTKKTMQQQPKPQKYSDLIQISPQRELMQLMNDKPSELLKIKTCGLNIMTDILNANQRLQLFKFVTDFSIVDFQSQLIKDIKIEEQELWSGINDAIPKICVAPGKLLYQNNLKSSIDFHRYQFADKMNGAISKKVSSTPFVHFIHLVNTIHDWPSIQNLHFGIQYLCFTSKTDVRNLLNRVQQNGFYLGDYAIHDQDFKLWKFEELISLPLEDKKSQLGKKFGKLNIHDNKYVPLYDYLSAIQEEGKERILVIDVQFERKNKNEYGQSISKYLVVKLQDQGFSYQIISEKEIYSMNSTSQQKFYGKRGDIKNVFAGILNATFKKEEDHDNITKITFYKLKSFEDKTMKLCLKNMFAIFSRFQRFSPQFFLHGMNSLRCGEFLKDNKQSKWMDLWGSLFNLRRKFRSFKFEFVELNQISQRKWLLYHALNQKQMKFNEEELLFKNQIPKLLNNFDIPHSYGFLKFEKINPLKFIEFIRNLSFEQSMNRSLMEILSAAHSRMIQIFYKSGEEQYYQSINQSFQKRRILIYDYYCSIEIDSYFLSFQQDLISHEEKEDVVIMHFINPDNEQNVHTFGFYLGDLYDFFTLTKLVSKYNAIKENKTSVFRNYKDQQKFIEAFFEDQIKAQFSGDFNKNELISQEFAVMMSQFTPEGKLVVQSDNTPKIDYLHQFIAKKYLEYFGKYYVPQFMIKGLQLENSLQLNNEQSRKIYESFDVDRKFRLKTVDIVRGIYGVPSSYWRNSQYIKSSYDCQDTTQKHYEKIFDDQYLQYMKDSPQKTVRFLLEVINKEEYYEFGEFHQSAFNYIQAIHRLSQNQFYSQGSSSYLHNDNGEYEFFGDYSSEDEIDEESDEFGSDDGGIDLFRVKSEQVTFSDHKQVVKLEDIDQQMSKYQENSKPPGIDLLPTIDKENQESNTGGDHALDLNLDKLMEGGPKEQKNQDEQSAANMIGEKKGQPGDGNQKMDDKFQQNDDDNGDKSNPVGAVQQVEQI